MKKYQALTIGPIHRTTQKAESLKGLWAASFIFSFLMKSIIERLILSGVYKEDFVIPLVTDDRIFEPIEGAGLFPDRLIFRTDENNYSKIISAIDLTLEELVCLTKDNLKARITHFDENKYRDYLEKYLVLSAVALELSETANIIEECNKALSILELEQPLISEEPVDYLHELIEIINKTPIAEKAGLSQNRFPSIYEISTNELCLISKEDYELVLSYYPDEDDDASILKELKAFFSTQFKLRHKYIAIISADGDNMGKVVEYIYQKDRSLVKEVDRILLDFNIEAVKTISSYGGKSIYLGGDDLLFFAPVSFGEEKNVFKLVDELSKKYEDKFDLLFQKCEEFDYSFWMKEDHTKLKQPTISFGISISYYKYPMFESLNLASKLLHEAKRGRKNAISFQVTKRSGNYFKATISKDTNLYRDKFVASLNISIEDDSFLNSVHYQLHRTEHVILSALLEEDKEVVSNYFDNFFNEPIHGKKEEFMTYVKDFLWATFGEVKNAKEALNIVYSTLRTVQFINQKDNDNE